MARGEWEQTTQFIRTASEILEAEHPMTVRQLFYRLVSAGVLKNSDKHYHYVSRMMTKARLDGRIEFDWIVDRSRPEYEASVWKDVTAYGKAIKNSYRKDYWELQPCYAEIWCEKDAVIGSIQDVTNDYGVRVVVGRGFQSTTRVQEIAERLASKQDKEIHVFYLGDHDPSGVDIQRDLRERVWSALLDLDACPSLEIERLAIHASDIQDFNLPPLLVKDSDSRAAEFTAKHGPNCVELDALPPSELRRRIAEAVEGILDKEGWDRAVRIEGVELASIRDFVANLKPALPGQA
jgi:5S rRNA maturation endonuclease (ribonuclease M5)